MTKNLSGGVSVKSDVKGKVLWFTGLSGSGKSTIAEALAENMNKRSIVILDGDIMRKGLCSDLGFSLVDRQENIRRVSEVAKICSNSGIDVICCFITPTEATRKIAKDIIGKEYFEIFVDCPLEVCEERDVKGLYAKARSGEIKNFTGIGSPFIPPTSPNIVLKTDVDSPLVCVLKIIKALQ